MSDSQQQSRALVPRSLLIALIVALVLLLGAVAALALRPWEGGSGEAAATPSESAEPSETPTETPSETPSETPTEEPSEEPSEPGAPVPDAVSVIDAGQGGGSGEIVLHWDGVPLAVGYRVYRAENPGGPFTVAAEVDASSGENNLGGPFVWKPGPNSFEYIEVTGDGPVYFQVVAFGEFEDGPSSVVVCGGADGVC